MDMKGIFIDHGLINYFLLWHMSHKIQGLHLPYFESHLHDTLFPQCSAIIWQSGSFGLNIKSVNFLEEQMQTLRSVYTDMDVRM